MEILLYFIIIPIITAQLECPFPEESFADYEEECRKYSACVWSPENSRCEMDVNEHAGYIVTSEMEHTGRGFLVSLKKFDPARSMFNGDILNLSFEVIHHEDYHLQIKIYDPSKSRYEVPLPLKIPEEPGTAPFYSVSVSENGSSFSFSVKRSSTGITIFETLGPLSFEDQFIQFSTTLSSTYFYGLGEAYHTTFRHSFDTRKTYPMFARDQALGQEETNEYGVHPYYVNIEDKEGNTHSVLFYNSNAMECSTFSLDDGSPALTYRTIGGIIDLHFFLGPRPEDVNIQYSNAIGPSIFPPYWSLGFHLSRYGYRELDNVRDIRQDMKDAGMPQDGQMIDLDYMDRKRDFTYDPIYWSDFPSFIDELHDDGVKITLISYTAIDFNNPAYATGVEKDVFIKWMDEDLVPEDQVPGANNYMVGLNHPDNKTVYPDYFNPETRNWWYNECQAFHDQLDFDGLWVDMNEPRNFITNADPPYWCLTCPINTYDAPPYPTKASYIPENESQRLSDQTLCMSGMHNDGNNSYLHYDVHNLNGVSAAQATYETMERIFPGKRPFALTRSTFPGSGRYSAYYLGVNYPTTEFMKQSIIGILEFNLFNIPFVGADICGYFGDSDEQLCARWMQLGAFYPFSRNHNSINAIRQDPANPYWTLVNQVSLDVLLLRYKYLPYLYLLFYKASTKGGSVARPLFNVFPSDIDARDIDDQFFWGDGIMIAPVIADDLQATRDVYFPQGLWYELVNGTLASSVSESVQVDAPIEKIPVYVRGGVILPFQEPNVTTSISRNNAFGLTVALDESKTAEGEIYWDDGESVYSMDTSFTSFIKFSNNTLKGEVKIGGNFVMELNYGTIQFFGYPSDPSSVSINGEDLEEIMWNFNMETNVLILTIDTPMSDDITIELS